MLSADKDVTEPRKAVHSHKTGTPQVYMGLKIGQFLISGKGTHTVYFISSLYIINQKPMIPRTHFHWLTTWVARSSG